MFIISNAPDYIYLTTIETDKAMTQELKFDDLPKEIKDKMLEHQESQTGFADPDVFRREITAYHDGFYWAKSPEGDIFWDNILLMGRGYEEFYKLYPKKEIREKPFPREMWCWNNSLPNKKVKELVFAVIPERNSEYKVIGITNTYTDCSEIEEELVELTLKDISEGKGVGVDPELIRIKE